jgi:hypothetical protein
MQPISYARHRFPPDVIRHAVWLYLRFTLSYRDVEDLQRRARSISAGQPVWRARSAATVSTKFFQSPPARGGGTLSGSDGGCVRLPCLFTPSDLSAQGS